MKSKMTLLLPFLTLMATTSTPAADYMVDPSHSKLGFIARHLVVSKVRGEFQKFDGSFSFDATKPESLKVKVEAETASIFTNDGKRDEHLRSADFFDAAKNPKLIFESKKAKSTGKDSMDLSGDLTMHGITKPVTFKVEYLGASKDPWGNSKVGFSAKTKVSRKDWGLTWNKALETGGVLVSEEIELEIDVEGNLKK